MVVRFLQANLNHVRQAQHLFMQSLAERDIGLAIVSEPYRIPDDNSNWIGDDGGSAAVVRVAADLSPPLKLIGRGAGYAAAKWGPYNVISCYAPPAGVSVLLTRFWSEWG